MPLASGVWSMTRQDGLNDEPPENATKDWYLIQCKVRQDGRAEEHLVRQGYQCYRPMYRCERLLKGRVKLVEESLFPGYVFVQLGLQDSWAALRSTRGVLRVVGFGGKPTAIRAGLVEQLQRRQQVEEPLPLVAGEKVRIVEGPFAELEAVFLEMDGKARVVLLLGFLQRQQKIQIPLTGIRKI